MRKRIIAGAVIIAFCLGLASGGVVALGWFWGHISLRQSEGAAFVRIADALMPLRQLRDGNVEKAVERLEIQMDLGISDLSMALRYGSGQSALTNIVIRRAKDYRAAYPRADALPLASSLLERVVEAREP